MLTPVLLLTFGRCGSTYLMHILASADTIHFGRAYPYEVRELTYLYRLAKYTIGGLARPSDWSAEKLILPNPGVIGPYPYAATEGSVFSASDCAWFKLFKGMWQAYSEHARECSSGVRYYAEKSPHDVVRDISPQMYTKNIFLVRDPRDELVSIREFNKKRGYNGFGWQPQEQEIAYAKRLCDMRRGFFQTCADFVPSDRRLLLTYEKIIENEESQVTRLEEFLDTELDRTKIHQAMPGSVRHATAKSPERSVRRWKNELNADVCDLIWNELGDSMEKLGYRKT